MQNDTNQQQLAAQESMQPQLPPQAPYRPGTAPKKRHRIWLIILVIIGVIAAVPLLIMLAGMAQKALNAGAETLFYESISKASQEQKIHFEHAQYRYESEQDKAANKLSSSLNSIAEFDNATNNYSAVYMQFTGDTYFLGRCVNGKEYEHKKTFIKTLQEAQAELATPAIALEKNHQIRSACDFKHVFRSGFLSDGIIPAGFTAQQAQNWIDGLKHSELLEIKDEGQSEYKGKKGRKISFTQKKGTADAFFYAFRDGKSDEVGANSKDFFRFDRVLDNLRPAPRATGFYLIDEKEKLPFYSEFTTVAAPKQEAFEPLISKNAYTYGSFSITEKTNIELR